MHNITFSSYVFTAFGDAEEKKLAGLVPMHRLVFWLDWSFHFRLQILLPLTFIVHMTWNLSLLIPRPWLNLSLESTPRVSMVAFTPLKMETLPLCLLCTLITVLPRRPDARYDGTIFVNYEGLIFFFFWLLGFPRITLKSHLNIHFTIHPHLLQFVYHETVEKVNEVGGKVTGVTTRHNGDISAPIVVDCAGKFSVDLFKDCMDNNLR